ncbi:MAG TPA: DUF2252 domain-containing protein [Candidatus Angelobacter sp.]|jgi:uncharacterized protein (DUF2252 family)|nr:DUF2252 domain-containing protein [Candidatus Angelobacter sp.]
MSPKSKAKSGKPKATKSAPAKSAEVESAAEADLSQIFMPGGGPRARLREVDKDWPLRHKVGKALRQSKPREGNAGYTPAANRPDPLDLLAISNKGRVDELIPLRMGRMAASPFTFLRGAACVMAWDLSKDPVSGINVIVDGDAHVNNFGMYGTPMRDVIFDLNDFDEATIGPWEWDLKRLVASVNVAARENGMNKGERAEAVRQAVWGYRWNMQRLESMGVLDTWYLHVYPDTKNPVLKRDPKSQAVIMKTLAKAKATTNATLFTKITEKGPDGWRFHEDPPIMTKVSDKVREAVIKGLEEYWHELPTDRAFMLSRYHVVDVAHRVVGVGSVGTRAYLALLLGNDDNDPLFLQVKESVSPALAPYAVKLPPPYDTHHGLRVCMGQRALQAEGDVMLGPTHVDGRPFFVRQMKNMKASIPVEYLTGESFNFYAKACGSLLSRAHARTGDCAAIAGYCGKTPVLDEALVKWAEAYGNQTVQDHARLVEAIKNGKIKAIQGV